MATREPARWLTAALLWIAVATCMHCAHGQGAAPPVLSTAAVGPAAWLDNDTAVALSDHGLILADVDGTVLDVPVQDSPMPGVAPLPSPDGGRVAYLTKVGPETSRVAVVAAQGGRREAVGHASPAVAWGNWGAWAPHGAALYYSGQSNATPGADLVASLYALDLATGTETRITENPTGADLCPTFLSEGRGLAFMRVDPARPSADAASLEGPLPVSEVVLADAGADSRVQILTRGHVDRKPVGSPSGRYVAFLRLDSVAGVSLWAVEIETRDERLLVDGTAYRLSLHLPMQWSADGEALYFVTRERLCQVNVATAEVQTLDLGMPVTGWFAVSPTGKWVAYQSRDKLHLAELASP